MADKSMEVVEEKVYTRICSEYVFFNGRLKITILNNMRICLQKLFNTLEWFLDVTHVRRLRRRRALHIYKDVELGQITFQNDDMVYVHNDATVTFSKSLP